MARVECGGVPVRVVIKLRTPMALYGWPWIAFDGLLAHLAARARDPDGFRTIPSNRVMQPEELVPDLPLTRVGMVYSASIGFPDTDEKWRTSIYKRFYLDRFPLDRVRKRKLEIAKGEFRSWKVNLVLVPARQVVFYARGDPDQIRQLLAGLYSLGHRRAAGFGIVDSIMVEEAKHDWSLIDSEGRATRPIPVEMLEHVQGPTYIGTYQPPYWDKRKTTLLAAPGALVRLKQEYTCI